MEKLQAALQKARNRRNEQPPRIPRVGAPSKTGGENTPGSWSQLRQIEPQSEWLTSHHVVTRKPGGTAEPFDILRTKLLLQMQQSGWKSLAVTSPMPKCGKSTVATNLALGLGRQSGLRTILFDMDLKQPMISTLLGHKPDHDISDMLSGKVSFADQAVRVGENVAFSMSTRAETDPTQILLSDKTHQTIAEVVAAYSPDAVIFDMPSILVGDNTRAFLKHVDCALIVTRANNTSYGHFNTCEREVAQYTNVVGTVLNAFKAKQTVV